MPTFPRTAIPMYYPTISCLCPTYGRPTMLRNAIACFVAQDYPIDRCKLVILDDLGTILPHVGPMQTNQWKEWPTVKEVVSMSTNKRYDSLPKKYNALLGMAPISDLYVVWEDDDIQLPWCLQAHAAACRTAGWSYPSHVFSDYADNGIPNIHIEGTGGRFHGCLGIRRETIKAIGGWPDTKRADFDQQLISRLKGIGDAGNPILAASKPPAYLFRWCQTPAHGQSEMRSPDDTTWYDRYSPPDRSGPHRMIPEMDPFTQHVYGAALDGPDWYPLTQTP
jgi:hypothetical protein